MSNLSLFMNNLPILQELFESDSTYFLLLGIGLAVIISFHSVKRTQVLLIALGISFCIYLLCEFAMHFSAGYMSDLLLLFFGTTALGAFIGFFLSMIKKLFEKKAE